MRKWFVSAFAGLIGAVFLASPLAMAATTATPAPNGSPGQGLEISPPVIELTANPGQTVTTNIGVRNVTAGVLFATADVNDFGAGSDENGNPKILLDESGETRYSLRYWVQPLPSLTLAPQELQNTQVKIVVPANAEPGGHYGVVRFTATAPSMHGTGVALSASVGALVLLRVNGAITENLSVVQFGATQNEKFASFFEHGPLTFVVRLQNNGNVHEDPQGSISITGTFGEKVASVAVNTIGGNVLPASIRRFESTMSNKQLFGHYTAHLDLTYAGSKTVIAAASFWVIPWKLLLLILVGLIVAGYLLKISIRKYNEHIINMARRR
jgi:hypothetical protein